MQDWDIRAEIFRRGRQSLIYPVDIFPTAPPQLPTRPYLPSGRDDSIPLRKGFHEISRRETVFFIQDGVVVTVCQESCVLCCWDRRSRLTRSTARAAWSVC